MRLINLLIILFLSLKTIGQKLTQDFTGSLKYDIKYYSAFIKRDSCGGYIDKRILIKSSDYFQAWDTSFMREETQEYLPSFFVKGDTFLRLVYLNPKKQSNDTIDQFPLSKGDTISSRNDYLLYADSFYIWNSSNNSRHFNEVRIAPDYSETTNIGDTIINVLGQQYNCYRFEKFHYTMKSNPGYSHLRYIIYIDQVSLLPLQEEWFYWYYMHPCIKTKEWILQKKVELVEIKNVN